MRGSYTRTGELFSYVDLEDRVPLKHPLRVIRRIVNEVPVRGGNLDAFDLAQAARLARFARFGNQLSDTGPSGLRRYRCRASGKTFDALTGCSSRGCPKKTRLSGRVGGFDANSPRRKIGSQHRKRILL